MTYAPWDPWKWALDKIEAAINAAIAAPAAEGGPYYSTTEFVRQAPNPHYPDYTALFAGEYNVDSSGLGAVTIVIKVGKRVTGISEDTSPETIITGKLAALQDLLWRYAQSNYKILSMTAAPVVVDEENAEHEEDEVGESIYVGYLYVTLSTPSRR